MLIAAPPTLGRRADHSGRRFGMLVAIKPVENMPNRGARWLCACDCGSEKIVPADTLVKGKSKSCGCSSEAFRQPHRHKHGHTKVGFRTATYGSWHAAQQRCQNPKHKHFADYGGRGITFCDRWLDFRNFLADLGERPKGHTLDREDPQGNYEPGNCRWATPSEQMLNQRPKVRQADVAPLVAAVEAVIAARDADPRAQIDRLAVALAAFENRRRNHALAS